MISEAEQEAMRQMGRRWLDEVRPLVLMEGVVGDPADVGHDLNCYAKVLDCLTMVLCDDFPGLFGVTGFVLGGVYAEHDPESRAVLNAALADGLTQGVEAVEEADGPAPQVGRA